MRHDEPRIRGAAMTKSKRHTACGCELNFRKGNGNYCNINKKMPSVSENTIILIASY